MDTNSSHQPSLTLVRDDPLSLSHTISSAHILSHVLGYGYVLAWSVSFYPQLILNYQRQGIHGLSLSFLIFNLIGFSFYMIYTLSFYFSPAIQNEYKKRNNGHSNLVSVQDLVFVIHAWLLTVITCAQARYYKTTTTSQTEISSWSKLFLLIIFGSTLIMLGYTLKSIVAKGSVLDLIYFLGTWKLVLSFAKYLPQMVTNYQLKSTCGWSIHNIILDASGGILSLIQLFVDGWISTQVPPGSDSNWVYISIFGNFTKFGLSILSLAFDSVFVVQHYILYPQVPAHQSMDDPTTSSADDEQTSILQDAQDP